MASAALYVLSHNLTAGQVRKVMGSKERKELSVYGYMEEFIESRAKPTNSHKVSTYSPLYSHPQNASDGVVYNNCRPRLSELYQKQVAQTPRLQIAYAHLWTQC